MNELRSLQHYATILNCGRSSLTRRSNGLRIRLGILDRRAYSWIESSHGSTRSFSSHRREASMASAAPHDPPFRADHVGSLLRPLELLKARADRAAGRLSAEQLRRFEDEAIREVVAF